jgi:PDZ domain-containing protein
VRALRSLRPGRVLGTGLVLLLIASALWVLPSDKYIFLPDPAHPAAPLVSVPNPKPDRNGGGIYFVDVIVRKANWLERLIPGLHESASLVPADVVNPQGESDKQRRKEDLRAMKQSQSVAAAVALHALGYGNLIHLNGIAVRQVVRGTPAAGRLRRGDVIVSANGRAAKTACTLQRILAERPPGSESTLEVGRGGRVRQVRVKPITDSGSGRRLIGIIAEPLVRIDKLPIPVKIDAGQVGGPSAGLAFTLQVSEELGRDVDRGLKVAATGTMEADGCVDAIGGVKQKTAGARDAGVDVFLVPAGDNYREAKRYAHGLPLVPVRSYPQALSALAQAARHR